MYSRLATLYKAAWDPRFIDIVRYSSVKTKVWGGPGARRTRFVNRKVSGTRACKWRYEMSGSEGWRRRGPLPHDHPVTGSAVSGPGMSGKCREIRLLSATRVPPERGSTGKRAGDAMGAQGEAPMP